MDRYVYRHSAHTRGSTLQFKTHAYLFADTGEDGTNLKLSSALVGLAVVTGLVALLSEYLVDAIDGFTEEVCRRNEEEERLSGMDRLL